MSALLASRGDEGSRPVRAGSRTSRTLGPPFADGTVRIGMSTVRQRIFTQILMIPKGRGEDV
jgi:hypothetical protein